MSLPNRIEPDRHAIFLDFDGTLVELAERPELVQVTDDTRTLLSALNTHFSGAVAIITGRDITIIDNFLSPLKLPVAGVHGLIRRDVNGEMHKPLFDTVPLDAVAESLHDLMQEEPDLFLERKQGAIVLHYRQRPDLEDRCKTIMTRIAEANPSITLRMGKMVIEAVAFPTDKGRAIESFLGEPPYIGRTPVFAGDDVTDEDGFLVVNRRNGVSIKVGEGQTSASCRVADRTALIAWLNLILENSGYSDNA